VEKVYFLQQNPNSGLDSGFSPDFLVGFHVFWNFSPKSKILVQNRNPSKTVGFGKVTWFLLILVTLD